MARPIRVATILADEPEPRRRLRLELHRDDDCYRWYDTEGHDSEVSADTVEEACKAATVAWSGTGWDLQASWLL